MASDVLSDRTASDDFSLAQSLDLVAAMRMVNNSRTSEDSR